MRRSAAGAAPPSRSGGCGRCTGLGSTRERGTSVARRRRRRRCRRSRWRGGRRGAPRPERRAARGRCRRRSNSSGDQPRPRPASRRPPLRWSMVVSCLASTMGADEGQVDDGDAEAGPGRDAGEEGQHRQRVVHARGTAGAGPGLVVGIDRHQQALEGPQRRVPELARPGRASSTMLSAVAHDPLIGTGESEVHGLRPYRSSTTRDPRLGESRGSAGSAPYTAGHGRTRPALGRMGRAPSLLQDHAARGSRPGPRRAQASRGRRRPGRDGGDARPQVPTSASWRLSEDLWRLRRLQTDLPAGRARHRRLVRLAHRDQRVRQGRARGDAQRPPLPEPPARGEAGVLLLPDVEAPRRRPELVHAALRRSARSSCTSTGRRVGRSPAGSCRSSPGRPASTTTSGASRCSRCTPTTSRRSCTRCASTRRRRSTPSSAPFYTGLVASADEVLDRVGLTGG